MKSSDVKLGMKVVPHAKTTNLNEGLENSEMWKRAQMDNQPYLFVIEWHSGHRTRRSSTNARDHEYDYEFTLSNRRDTELRGDFFNPEDFEPYVDPSTYVNPSEQPEKLNGRRYISEEKVEELLKMQIEEVRIFVQRCARDYGMANQEYDKWISETPVLDIYKPFDGEFEATGCRITGMKFSFKRPDGTMVEPEPISFSFSMVDPIKIGGQ